MAGHAIETAEDIVERHERYIVVEKHQDVVSGLPRSKRGRA
jgi:hypothetical protein